jgi:hypothetical protein
MSEKSRSPARYLVHRQGTVENLITQGLKALESSPASPYTDDWHRLLDRLEVLTLNASPNPKTVNESNNGDYAFPTDAVAEDNVPKRYVFVPPESLTPPEFNPQHRILREVVSYLRTKDSISPSTRDVELSKYKSLVSQLDKHCRVRGSLKHL